MRDCGNDINYLLSELGLEIAKIVVEEQDLFLPKSIIWFIGDLGEDTGT